MSAPKVVVRGGSSGENLEAPSWGFFAVIKRVLKSVMSGMSLEG